MGFQLAIYVFRTLCARLKNERRKILIFEIRRLDNSKKHNYMVKCLPVIMFGLVQKLNNLYSID